MERARIERHLIQADSHVQQGEQHVLRQRELITELERDGHDTTEAEALLALFEETLGLHIKHRDRLRRDLDAI